MSIINRFNTELRKSFDDYVNTYLGPEGVAFTSPNKTAYDIAVNEAAAKVPSQALEGTFPGMAGQVLGTASDIVMPAIALGSSPFYDMYQASERARAKYGEPDVLGITGDSEIPMGPSFPEYAKAVADENIISSAIGRTAGAGKNLANRFSRIKDGIVANIPESIFTSAYAPEISEKDRQSIDITDKLNDYYEKGEMMDNVVDAPEDGIFEGLKNKLDPRNALGFLANVYMGGGMKQALTTSGLGKLFSKIAEVGRNTPNYQFTNPNKSGFNRIGSDFYDPKTGLDRFDRAKTLFGQSRTMKDFLNKLKDKRENEKAAAAQALANARQAIADAGSGFDDYGSGQGAGMGFGGGRSDPTDKS
jgi:hypothetical protein